MRRNTKEHKHEGGFVIKKSFLAGTLAMVVLAAVLAAGCTNPLTASPTPSSSNATTTATENVSQFLGATMQQQSFSIVTPFLAQPNTPNGIAQYDGTVSDSNGVYLVSFRDCNDPQLAQTQFTSLRDTYIGQGYATVQQTGTYWVGFNPNTGKGASVEYGTSPLMPNYCMVITGGGAPGYPPYQQAMWTTAWNNVHQYHPNDKGYGVGQYMGQGMNDQRRVPMQQEIQTHRSPQPPQPHEGGGSPPSPQPHEGGGSPPSPQPPR
jgi:hypothetical protein